MVHGADWSSGAGVTQLARTGISPEVTDSSTSGGVVMHGVDPNPANHAVEIKWDESYADLNEAGSATFSVWLSEQPTGDVTVTMTPDASNLVTLVLSVASLTFTTSSWAQADKQTVTVSVADNSVDEDVNDENGWQYIRLEASGGGADGAYTDVVFWFIDNDDATGPNVTLSAEPTLVKEGSAVTIKATLSEDPSADVTIPLTIPAPDAADREYDSPSTSKITISGMGTGTTGTLSIQTNEDNDKVDESFTVELDTDHDDWPADWSAGTASSVTITIDDNDKPRVTLSASPNPVGEGSTLTITATLSEDPSSDVTIPLTIPAPGDDEYTSPTNAEITIAGMGTGKTGTLDIQTNQDEDTEDETFTVALDTDDTGWPSGWYAGTPLSVEITINDNDEVVTLDGEWRSPELVRRRNNASRNSRYGSPGSRQRM